MLNCIIGTVHRTSLGKEVKERVMSTEHVCSAEGENPDKKIGCSTAVELK
jgi:hypothetical protein